MNHKPAAKKLITVEEAARTLGVSTKWVYHRIWSGDLPHVDLSEGDGRAVIRIRPEDLDHFIVTRRRP